MSAAPAERLVVDTGLCFGSGQCVQHSPGLFEQRDEDGLGRPLVELPAGEALHEARSAVELCPSGAISLRPAGA
ncbi:ferredoxin [Kitasatospora sp. NBC_00458]|uniref:ferredoxin n=1 Tax=Kitasatospora sp. NBC_00458 TaxID=2903568 RepID=UPI002E18BFE9